MADSERSKQVSIEQWEYLTNHLTESILLVDSQRKIVGCNKAALETYGYDKDEFLSLSNTNLKPPENWDALMVQRKNEIEKENIIFESIHRRKDGQKFPVAMIIRKIELEGRWFFQYAIRNILEQKQSERKLKKLNQIYSLLSNINQLIVRTHDKQNLLDEACRIAIEGDKFSLCVIEEIDADAQRLKVVSSCGIKIDLSSKLNLSLSDATFGKDPTTLSIATGKPVICNDISSDYYTTPWGELALKSGLHSHASFPLLIFNQPVGVISFYSSETNFFTSDEIKLLEELSSDISFSLEFLKTEAERNQILEKLQESNRKYQSFFEDDIAGVYLSTPAGKITTCNPAFFRIFGFTNKETVDAINAYNLYDRSDDREKFLCLLKEKKKLLYYETQMKRADGSQIYIIENAIGKFDNGNNLLEIKGYVIDITEIKIAERKIIEAKDYAEEMHRLKSNFLAQMSHELRTPMIGILGFTEILSQEIANEEHLTMVKTMRTSAVRLMDTLNLILELSRIQANRLELHLTTISLGNSVKTITSSFENLAKSKNLYLKVQVLDENITVSSDEKFLEIILKNLIDNAIKYTERGSITIEVSSRVSDGTTWAIIKIIDTGIGIPKENISVIFEEFRQVSEGFGRLYEGTGIGLSITKKLVEIMNGKIFVESLVELGSTFSIAFPCKTYS